MKKRTRRLGVVCLLSAGLTLSSFAVSAADPAPHKTPRQRRDYIRVTNSVSQLVEEYDRAKEELKQAKARLGDLQATYRRLTGDARAARDRLAARVAEVFQENASQLGILLGSSSMGELSDRAAFLSGLVGDDADLVTNAKVKTELARRAGLELTQAVRREQGLLKLIKERSAEIRATLPYQQSLENVFGNQSGPGSASSANVGSGSGAVAVRAALSALGRPYVFGAAGPSAFDCSGLMMWAWAQAGVSLPHSSSMQYATLPHVSLSQLQPGDLVFSYSPIHHVGMYIGGGQFVHAPHSGDVVRITSVAGYPVVGAARPG
ncbi:MAG TPA: NlpC/P60 family protein [Actinomycetota bacterium]|jgi:cell wall-associated NlpC family hydrolase